MRRFIFVLMMFLVVGCGIIHPRYVPVETKTDSVYVEHLVKDTVTVEIPGETVYVVAQDSSHLETRWSVSDAKIDSTGRLHHSLTNKDIKIEKEIVYKEVEKKVQVEKEVKHHFFFLCRSICYIYSVEGSFQVQDLRFHHIIFS